MSSDREANANPHEEDHCVVCSHKPTADGPSMHPVASIEDGCVCQDCVDATDAEESEISREELRELLDEISAQGVEQLQRNPRDERPYLHGQGAGITNAAAYIARRFDLEDFDDE